MLATEAMRANSAVRCFTSKPMDRQVIEELIGAAILAPTAMHMEPWAFAVVQDQALLQRLSEDAKKHTIAQVSALPEEHRDRLIARAKDPDFNVFYNTGTLIAVCGEPVGAFVQADCWMAAQNLMIAASERGLGTCVIGLALGAINTPSWKQALGIPERFTAYAPIILGEPSAEKTQKIRKKPTEFWTPSKDRA